MADPDARCRRCGAERGSDRGRAGLCAACDRKYSSLRLPVFFVTSVMGATGLGVGVLVGLRFGIVAGLASGLLASVATPLVLGEVQSALWLRRGRSQRPR